MKGLWCYYLRRWSPQYCAELIKRCEKYNFETAVVGAHEVQTEVRRSRIKFIPSSDPDFRDVFNDLWLMAIEANQGWFGSHISRLEFFQLTEYQESDRGEYKTHHDVFWITNNEYHRKLSCTVQLTDSTAYEGGNFELIDGQAELPKAEDLRTQGTAFFFPSFINHKVNPVTKGTRYSLVAWFEGPKWR